MNAMGCFTITPIARVGKTKVCVINATIALGSTIGTDERHGSVVGCAFTLYQFAVQIHQIYLLPERSGR